MRYRNGESNNSRGTLVLTRRPGESICIGPDVVVTVLSCEPFGVRIAVSAPRSVEIDRAEVRARKGGRRK